MAKKTVKPSPELSAALNILLKGDMSTPSTKRRDVSMKPDFSDISRLLREADAHNGRINALMEKGADAIDQLQTESAAKSKLITEQMELNNSLQQDVSALQADLDQATQTIETQEADIKQLRRLMDIDPE